MKNKSSISFAWLAILTSVLLVALNRLQGILFISEIPYHYMIGICLFMFAYGLSTILVVNKKIKTESPKRIISLYMLLKGAKILLFLMTVVLYMLVVRVEAKRFVLVAVAIYCFYLLLDTVFLTSIEKREKKNEKQ